jgi:antitoxin component YwqK of YwqJK toxin-antitoxin module
MALGLALRLAAAAPPLVVCPQGTLHRGARPMEGFEEYCVEITLDGKDRREGPALSYYDDGSTWIESRYRDGLLHGPYREHYRGGRIAREGAYEAGLRSGPWRFYYPDGTLQEETTFVRGGPDGPFVQYWPNGKVKSSGRHCVGVQCGRWRSYDDSGREIGTIEFGEQKALP